MSKTSASIPRLRISRGRSGKGERRLPAEVPVALSYNGSTHAVMMATPADLEDFAYGFSLNEGIAEPDEIRELEVAETEDGIDLRIWLSESAGNRHNDRRRTVTGPVGCGLCGLDSLKAARRPLPPVPDTGFAMSEAEVLAAAASLTAHQPLQDETRAVHAAAFWQGGQIIAAREDVGRHNALDKLTGALLRQDAGQSRAGAFIITSRISIDMVQKCASFGAPVLIAVSAPTLAAVDLAEDCGITLAALVRADSFEIFTHPDRIKLQEDAHVA
ncbi:formate dehydrogenase accessory protein [Pannonibacter phragmitetus]|uniref:Sulfur carrier protein FdhD n=1 Tax=Pannonibacter phragmitetus TaxID=121719 RepID=A0A378ZW35_9HYPH|nr:formate dehydrogenase accessory sulfurtransferase FdhD [Pannonibacter phragmitetus]SUB01456.1 formate dehydrogenase accessory protein [Pannonibacter phragmitetus]